MGSVDNPLTAGVFALGAGARFVARAIDTQAKPLSQVMRRAKDHKGASFLEIFQNCLVYNDDVFADFTDKSVAADMQLPLEHGKPMLYGKEKNKGIRLNRDKLELEAVTLGENGVSEADILIHDETNRTLAGMLARLNPPSMPMALGVLYCDPGPTYVDDVMAQIEKAKAAKPKADLNAVLRGGDTWTVAG